MPRNRLTTKEFIIKGNQVHGDKYDYSKVEYVNNKTKVIIICPDHGEFKQTPQSHLKGSDCFNCALIERSNKKRSNAKEFIAKAKEVHGDEYNYSKVVYINSNTKVVIICAIHGDFNQIPSSHLQGHGCYDCGFIESANKRRSSTEEFVTKAKRVHGEEYDCSKVDYKGSRNQNSSRVIIICSKHGEFLTLPNNFLRGSGCPLCGLEKQKAKRKKRVKTEWLSLEEFIKTKSNQDL